MTVYGCSGRGFTLVDYVSNRAARINKPGNMVPSINFGCVDLTSATTVEVVVRQGHITTIKRLLDHDVTMGMRVLRAAANNYGNGKEIMTLLLDRRGDQVFITEEVVKAAAGNDGNGKEIMTLLLDRRGDHVSITAEVVSAIAGRFDKETMALLLDRRRYQVSITEEVVNCPGSWQRISQA